MVSVLTQAFSTNLLYIDPAATSMLLTSITAIVVAAGAGIFIAWRAFKKKVNKVLHIDENAKKEVEDELVINDELKDGEKAESQDAVSEDSAAGTAGEEGAAEQVSNEAADTGKDK